MVVAVLLSWGCAARRPVIQNWRLVKQDVGPRLIPPDVLKPGTAYRTVNTGIKRGKGPCPPADSALALQPRGKHLHVQVAGDALAKQPTGWLGQWAAQLEEHDCVAPGQGMKLAVHIAESIPLDPQDAFRLLYSDDKETGEVDVNPLIRLQVVGPLWRMEGVGLMAEGPYSVKGSGYSLQVTGKSTENLMGYETVYYAVQASAGAIGSTIVPLYSDRSIQGKVERLPTPTVNYFPISSSARFYRLFYKSGQNDFTAILIGAATPAELNSRTKAMKTSSLTAPCTGLSAELCVVIPKAVAVNPLIAVTVNQAEALMLRGATVFQAIRRSGQLQPNEVLSTLTVLKPWKSKLIPVDFNRSDPAILRLVLAGGEVISWR
jgi:hypothetical protein